ncbi:MAG: BatA domain-containing protein, partial [Verrucomicrobia bacterium]|nr:BatA domain-containing protein [Verrucomicrobiota bacterium]
MTFLQPALLLGLPAILLPVLIHLLNRLRYKSVPWAAMMFLVSAARSSTKHARLRHYLILLSRALIILFLILTISRPIVGGWLANTLAGAPDTVLILLDRSASMESTDPRLQTSKRALALNRFVQAASTMGSSCRFVLVENAMNTPQEVAGVGALPALSMTGPTDTAADITAMLAAALDYMQNNASGRTEIWVASDMQSSNWRPDDGVWVDLAALLAQHPMAVRVRLLALTSDARENTSLSLVSL